MTQAYGVGALKLVPASDELARWMRTGWALDENPVPAAPVPHAEFCARRRESLRGALPTPWLVIPAGRKKRFSHDVSYLPFRPDSNFIWLTGFSEDDAVLVLVPPHAQDAVEARAVLFVGDRYGPLHGRKFFTDRRNGGLWVGRRPSLLEVEQCLGLTCRPRTELAGFIAEREQRDELLIVPGVDQQLETEVTAAGGEASLRLAGTLATLRLVKDEFELRSIERAVELTIAAFEEVAAVLSEESATERSLEVAFVSVARLHGRGPGFHPTIAAGRNATIPHWKNNDGAIVGGDLVLVDGGVANPDFYTADLTRTLPAAGRWSPVQLAVYEAVLEALNAALSAMRPGVAFLAAERAAHRVLVEHLVEWGVMAGDAEAIAEDPARLYQRYTLHGTCHPLGIDVHDGTDAPLAEWRDGVLRPGMVLTVEPGIYFQANDLTVPERLRGIGVRIEDDVVVTHSGIRNLSEQLPKEPEAVVSWLAACARKRR